jgi:site-specific recombinase XerD
MPSVRVPTTPTEQLVDEYASYLVRERGLAPSTVGAYVSDAVLFLAELSGPAGLDLEHLSSSTVSGFVLQASRRREGAPPGTAKALSTLATSLRSLLRFLHAEGRTPLDLTSAVPSVAAWRLGSLPRALDPGQVTLLLRSCDQATPIGRRDFAILTLLARLGLRSGEVALLSLDDMDWRVGEIIVHGKGSRRDRLPIPRDVGQAITSYLKMGRPRSECRRLFLRARAPVGGLSSEAIGMVVRAACDRVALPQVGAHRLRHALATDMLAHGAPLSEIGQVLRHVNPATTAIYAKVDRNRLQDLARPWPGLRP